MGGAGLLSLPRQAKNAGGVRGLRRAMPVDAVWLGAWKMGQNGERVEGNCWRGVEWRGGEGEVVGRWGRSGPCSDRGRGERLEVGEGADRWGPPGSESEGECGGAGLVLRLGWFGGLDSAQLGRFSFFCSVFFYFFFSFLF